MKLGPELGDEAVLDELGRRVARLRVDAALTQAELARQAGIAKRTLERIEAGQGSELASLVRVLRALGRLDGLEALVPDLPPSPVALMALRGRERRRVRSPVKEERSRSGARATAGGSAWKWGE